MFRESTFRRIVRASAWYDLLVTFPFAIAPGVSLVWPLFDALQRRMTGQALPPLDAHGMLFANFFGSVVVVWSLVRLVYDDPRLGRFDGVARLLFTAAMLRALHHGAAAALLGFVVVEAAFGVLQLVPLRASRSSAYAGTRARNESSVFDGSR